MVKLLLDSIGDHAAREKFIDSIVAWAAQTRTDNAMSLPLDQNEGLKEDAARTPTLLLWAVRKSYEGLAQRLIERNTAIDWEALSSQAALMWSTEYGHKALVELLLGRTEDS